MTEENNFYDPPHSEASIDQGGNLLYLQMLNALQLQEGYIPHPLSAQHQQFSDGIFFIFRQLASI